MALEPLTLKVIGIGGEEFVNTMSYEMLEWIKDTSLLWLTKHGGGQTTTEYQITM